ncbi:MULTISPECIES: hypothetical protein [Maribacter]|uniref:DUF3575 domain-containing protein n=1 Tax=Maribacter flavus TaxID=1658664 RepID=A0ABU7IHG3_9FLAO|nr:MULTISPECIES: hypothetical protein [Maribacter]MDC6404952.1 hypothetical protein [Maribacter sp. PR66]MEE1972366.1 hypothetical protein [Maribacter flavus]
MKNSLFVCLFFFFSLSAQSNKNVENGLVKVNVFIPGASYELGVSQSSTLNFDVALIPGGRYNSFSGSQLGILPGAQVEYRYYHNMGRRISRSKNISGNSGNYVAAVNQFYLGNSIIGNLRMDSSFYNIVALSYGIQRTKLKGFYWGISFGPGVGFSQLDTQPTLFVDAKLGWVISKRK